MSCPGINDSDCSAATLTEHNNEVTYKREMSKHLLSLVHGFHRSVFAVFMQPYDILISIRLDTGLANTMDS